MVIQSNNWATASLVTVDDDHTVLNFACRLQFLMYKSLYHNKIGIYAQCFSKRQNTKKNESKHFIPN